MVRWQTHDRLRARCQASGEGDARTCLSHSRKRTPAHARSNGRLLCVLWLYDHTRSRTTPVLHCHLWVYEGSCAILSHSDLRNLTYRSRRPEESSSYLEEQRRPTIIDVVLSLRWPLSVSSCSPTLIFKERKKNLERGHAKSSKSVGWWTNSLSAYYLSATYKD